MKEAFNYASTSIRENSSVGGRQTKDAETTSVPTDEGIQPGQAEKGKTLRSYAGRSNNETTKGNAGTQVPAEERPTSTEQAVPDSSNSGAKVPRGETLKSKGAAFEVRPEISSWWSGLFTSYF